MRYITYGAGIRDRIYKEHMYKEHMYKCLVLVY